MLWQSLLVTDIYSSVSKWLTLTEAAELLGIPSGKVSRLIQDHALISIKLDGVSKIPSEIIVDGEPLHSLKGTVSVLLDAGFTLESACEWLYTNNDSLGVTPMAALLSGRRAEIRRLAQALAL